MSQLVIYYNHLARDCTIDRGEDGKQTISIAEAGALYQAGKVLNSNLAFERLIANDFDPEKVEAEYAEEAFLDECRRP